MIPINFILTNVIINDTSDSISTTSVLFILKRKEDYHTILDSHIGLSTGLYNSASFMNTMLTHAGISSNLEVVSDNNAIDRQVTIYRPTHVIIEALWVVPQKFHILTKLHPTVTWIIRLHSEMPFISGEGIAMDWIAEYSKYDNILIGVNAPRMQSEVEHYLQHINNWSKKHTRKKVIYLPNYYSMPTDIKVKTPSKDNEYINIACFGAVRPLKNHLLQAHAAIAFANSIGKKLQFHINANRIEMKGDSAMNNLKGLFYHLWDNGHRLISHNWTPRDEFLKLCAKMDIGMQCNFSETFNIVGADLITSGVPLVGSKEIPWLKIGRCDPTNSKDMIEGLHSAYRFRKLNVHINSLSLKAYNKKSRKIWYKQFKEI
jgi:hypothetical protein